MHVSRTAIRSRSRHSRSASAVAALATAAAVFAAAASAAAAPATRAATTTASSPPDASANFSFRTLDNAADLTFNQLLGINANGLIAGYFGSGQSGHPNKGYLLGNDGAGRYTAENWPGSAQTQVTGLNDTGTTVGFWADTKGDNFGFYTLGAHRFFTADYPTNRPAKPSIDQLLGVNDSGLAVGFYNDASGNAHGYTYNITKHRYSTVSVPGATSVTAAAINNAGDIAGFETDAAGAVVGFVKLSPGGNVIKLSVPGATQTQAFGINDGDVVVGSYTVGTGSSAMTFGFIWAPGFGLATVNDPNGIGSTTLNGINDHGRIVGFYNDSSGNTDGMLATPSVL